LQDVNTPFKTQITSKNITNNSALFCGEKINDKRSGYGIQYFKNKDKFMGNFT
jgi:hypothetical protein